MINDAKEMSAYDLLFKISWYDKETRMRMYQDAEISLKLKSYLEEANVDR